MADLILTTKDDLRALIRDEVLHALRTNHPKQTPAPQEDNYLTIDEASSFLKIAKQTIYHNLDKIPHIKRGKLYFKKSDLLRYLEDGRQRVHEDLDREIEDALNTKKGGAK